MPAEKTIPTTLRLTPRYRELLEKEASDRRQTPSAFAREIVTEHLEGSKSDDLIDAVLELKAELDALRGELTRLRGLGSLRDDLWSVLGTVLMQVGNWNEHQVRDLLRAYKAGGRKE